MNDLHSVNIGAIVTGVIGLVAGVSGIILNFLNKDRYQTQVDVYKPENEELRAINSRKTAEIGELNNQIGILKTQVEEKEKQILKMADYDKIMVVMSNNHKAIMTKLTDITKKAMR